MLRKGYFLPAILFVTMTPYGAASERANVTLENVFAAWERSVESLQSFDVLIHVQTTYVMKTVTTTKKGVKGPAAKEMTLRSRDPSEPPGRASQFSRQVLSKHGKRRYELLPAAAGKWSEAVVFDGEIMRTLSAKTGSGGIRAKGPVAPLERSYAGLYRDLPYGGSLIALLRSRQGTQLVQGGAGDRDRVVIESPPEKGNYKTFGFRIFLSPKHGMMPAQIDWLLDSMDSLWYRTTIDKFREVEPGVWAPTEAALEFQWKGQTVNRYKIVVDVSHSRWNQPVSEDLFKLAFPVGTRVLDQTRNLHFVTGKPDAGGNIDQLLVGARKVMQAQRPAVPEPRSRTLLYAIVLLNIVALIVILTVLQRRARRVSGLRKA